VKKVSQPRDFNNVARVYLSSLKVYMVIRYFSGRKKR